MTRNTLYVTTALADVIVRSGQFTYSNSPYNRKLYAVKCDHGINAMSSTKVRL